MTPGEPEVFEETVHDPKALSVIRRRFGHHAAYEAKDRVFVALSKKRMDDFYILMIQEGFDVVCYKLMRRAQRNNPKDNEQLTHWYQMAKEATDEE